MRQRRSRIGLCALLLLVIGLPVAAAEHASDFGFQISVPDVWLVLTRTDVAENAAAFLHEGTEPGLESIPLSLRQAVYDRVQRGELEIFYRRDGIPGSFIDNVNILLQPSKLPDSEAQVARVCEILPTEFSRVFGRPISMDVCEMRERIGRRALYLQFDGAVPGTTTLQYQLQRGLDHTVILTATAGTENLPRLMSEFEGMIASIRLR